MTKRLLLMNGLAILAIPIQHATSYGFQAMFEWADRYRDVIVPNYDQLYSAPYYVMVVLRQLTTFAVPTFLFISGFFVAFMARGEKKNVSLETLLPRIRTLLFPLIVWTAIRYILLRQWPRTLDDVLDPYHFIPLLIQFYLLSPLLVPLARRHWKWLLVGAAFVHLGLQGLRISQTFGMDVPLAPQILSLSPRWLFYGQQPFWFPFGVVFGLHMRAFNAWLARIRPLLLPALIFFTVVGTAEYFVMDALNGPEWIGPSFSGFVRNFFITVALLYLLATHDKPLPFEKSLNYLASRSLGIYLANIPFIYVVAVIMYRLTPALLGIPILYQPILFAVGLFGPLALMWAVRRSPMRGAYRIMFG